MSTIHEQIEKLTAAGYSLDEILVNDGNDAWGDDCAVTAADAASTRADWANDEQNIADLPELPTAREWLAETAPRVTICTNTETLRPVWEDIYTGAGYYDTDYSDKQIGIQWCSVFSRALEDADINYEYESSFQYWHGGPGSGTYHYEGDDPRVAAACAAADAAAREAAQADVAEMEAADAD